MDSGRNVAVYDSGNIDAPVLFLVHGNSLGAFIFKEQFKELPAKNTRVIAIDLPGHGESDHAVNIADYRLDNLIESVITTIKNLELNNIVFAGHSMGGHLLLQGDDKLKEFARGYILFGTPPLNNPPEMEKMFFPHPAGPLFFKGELSEEEINTFANSLTDQTSIYLDDLRNSVKNTDPELRNTIGTYLMSGSYKNEVEIVQSLSIPLAVFQGENDKLINPSYFELLNIPTLWKNKIHIIKNAEHLPQLENPVDFNNLVIEFMNSI